MTLDEIMRTNGTCRFYKTDPVPDDLLTRVLDSARWAPSGGNRQPLRFIVVRDEGKKKTLKNLYLTIWNDFLDDIKSGEKHYEARPKLLVDADHFANHLDQIPILLVVCARLADVQPTDVNLDRLSIVGGASVYPAVQNVLLSARNLGLGTTLTTLLCSVEGEVKSLLQIPDDISTAAMVAIGWPAQAFPKQLRRRPLSTFTFVDTFGRRTLGDEHRGE